MSQVSLEQRVAALEREVAALRSTAHENAIPWWRRPGWARSAEDMAALDEVERLGRKYRESLRPKDVPSRKAKAKAVESKAAGKQKNTIHGRTRHGSRLAG